MTTHTGIPHDLPEYVSNTESPPRIARWRAQVYRGSWGWNWTHQCGPKNVEQGYGYLTWPMAMLCACEHMREHA